MSDYRIIVKVQNARIRRAMEKLGITTASELARLTNTAPTAIGELINLKVPARTARGEWRQIALRLAEVLQTDVEELFTERQQFEGMKRRVVSRDVEEQAIEGFLLANHDSANGDALLLLEAQEELTTLDAAIEALTPRQQTVLRARFGFGDTAPQTYEEIAKTFGVTRERIRQIEAKALRVLKTRFRKFRGSDFSAILSQGGTQP